MTQYDVTQFMVILRLIMYLYLDSAIALPMIFVTALCGLLISMLIINRRAYKRINLLKTINSVQYITYIKSITQQIKSYRVEIHSNYYQMNGAIPGAIRIELH